jgi:hypothetical protein
MQLLVIYNVARSAKRNTFVLYHFFVTIMLNKVFL